MKSYFIPITIFNTLLFAILLSLFIGCDDSNDDEPQCEESDLIGTWSGNIDCGAIGNEDVTFEITEADINDGLTLKDFEDALGMIVTDLDIVFDANECTLKVPNSDVIFMGISVSTEAVYTLTDNTLTIAQDVIVNGTTVNCEGTLVRQ